MALPTVSEDEIPITTQPASLSSTTASIATAETKLQKGGEKETEIEMETTVPSIASTLTIVSTTSDQLSDYLTTSVAATVITVPVDLTTPQNPTIPQDLIIPKDSTILDHAKVSIASNSHKMIAPPTQAKITSTAQTATSTIRLTSMTWASTQPTVTIATSTTEPTQFTVLTISTTSTEALITTNSTAPAGSDHSRSSSSITAASTVPTSGLSSWRPRPVLPSQMTAKTSRIDGTTPSPLPSSSIQISIRGKDCTRRH